jgi:hypothetical protein
MRREIHKAQNDRVEDKERDRDDGLYDAERAAANDASLTRITESGFANLRVVMSDHPRQPHQFTRLKGENITTIAAVMAMLSVPSDFGCDMARHCTKNGQFTFVAYCTRYRCDSSTRMRCPRVAMNLSVTTQQYGGHFFAASILPGDRRMPTIFLTSPRIVNIQGFG